MGNKALNDVVGALGRAAGKDDMASVQITSDGNCILRIGVTYSKHMHLQEFITWINSNESEAT
jgi:hypothetical protein